MVALHGRVPETARARLSRRPPGARSFAGRLSDAFSEKYQDLTASLEDMGAEPGKRRRQEHERLHSERQQRAAPMTIAELRRMFGLSEETAGTAPDGGSSHDP